MQTIANLIKNFTDQGQTILMPVLLIAALVVGGIFIMIGDHRGGRGWITGALLGAAVIIGAPTLASMVH